MKDKYQFAAISGSLRKGSYNTMLLKTLMDVAPSNIEITRLFIEDVPLYNQDDVDEKGFPEIVRQLGTAIQKADALILVSPEYNYSVPGVLKNAIDYISRLPDKPMLHKAVGIMGVSTGMIGTARCQYHIRQIMVFMDAYVMNKPEIMVAKAAEKFDEAGRLKDEKTLELLGTFLKALAGFSEKFS